jgi:hypothetical protein
VGNCGGNTGSMTYTTPVSRFWVKATTNGSGSYSDPNHWAGTSGGAGGQTVPLCHDSVYFDPNSIAAASQTITCDMPRIGSIDFTGVSNTPALSLNTNPNYYFGSVTFPSTMTFSIAGVPGFNLENRNNFNITINPTLNTNIYFNNYGATATILSDITCRSFSVNAGTVNLNNKNINSSYGFNPPGTITRVVNMGSGIYTSTTPYTWNITGATTGLTFNCDTSTLVFPAVYSFYGIGLTYYKVKNTSTGALTITGNNTFNTLESDPNSGSNQITLTASSNQTVSNLIASNTSATKTVTIASSDPNTAATLTKSSGIVCLKHTNINKVTATGGATFLVDQNSNLTNATGWTKMDETYPTFNSIGQRFNEANQTFYGNYGFQPPSIAGCKLWLDASRITGLSDGNSVTTWTDLSGNGNNATQSDPNLAPIYKVNIQNGLPAVRSDGINDRMSLINLLNSQTKSTVFLVVIPRKTTLYDSMFGQGVSNGFACYFQNDATTKFFHGGYNKVSGATTIGQCALLRMMCDGTNITNSLNNASSSPANSYGANTGTDTLSLFSMSGATYPSQVDICEIAIWNTDLTAGQITQLNTYFSRKYNLTLTP